MPLDFKDDHFSNYEFATDSPENSLLFFIQKDNYCKLENFLD